MNERETLFTELGVVEEDPPAVPPAYRDSEFVFVANTHPAVQAGLLSDLPDRTLAVADTMNLWIDVARAELMQVLQQVDGLVLNDAEAMQLTENQPMPSPRPEASSTSGRRFVVVKKGEHGAVLVHRDGVATVPAYPAELRPGRRPDRGRRQLRRRHDGPHCLRGLDRLLDPPGGDWRGGTVTASFALESFGLDPSRRNRPPGHR